MDLASNLEPVLTLKGVTSDANNFINDKILFVQDKHFVHTLKIIFALRKLV